MWVRRRLDIGWHHLAYARLRCVWPGRAQPALVEQPWAGDVPALVCLSVRSGFDLLLQALALPKDSEVLMSAINVPDMFRLVAEHGLTPVPLDFDGEDLRPSVDLVRRAITTRTRVVVVAHLFGTQLDLSALRALAREHRLLMVEDRAQAFCGLPAGMPPGCDVALWSFGPIKAATALGGAVVAIRDPTLANRMGAIAAGYRVQSRWRYLFRIRKYAMLKALSYRLPFALLVRVLTLAGRDYDAWMQRRVRGFDGVELLHELRRRPCAPLVALLNVRLRGFDAARAARQRQRGARFAAGVGDACRVVGGNTAFRSFDLLAVQVDDPRHVVSVLRRHGFDAGVRGNLACLTGAGDLDPVCARRLLDETVCLPLYPAMPDREVRRLAAVVRGATA